MGLAIKVLEMVEKTIRTHVILPKELVEAVDELVGQRKRSAFFVEAVEEKLKRERFGKALSETGGFLADDAHPEWATPEKVSAWVRDLRSVDREATDRKLSRLR